MKDSLLNLIPDDILNLIWKKVKPSIKYCVNKYYFNKFNEIVSIINSFGSLGILGCNQDHL